ncbi:MAG: transposase [Thiotrichales bacterium]|nr:transposase [Thiotrichales bacterium]
MAELVQLAMPSCKQAERDCPRTGRGRKPLIADWTLAVLIMVATVKQRKSKSSQYRFLAAHRRTLLRLLGVKRFPARSTYFDRFRRAHRLYQHAIRIEGRRAIQAGWTNARCVAVDQSIVPARGPRWNKRHQARGRVPRGADLEASWTYSAYHHWVLGYSYEVVVSAGKGGVVWPLLASADPAHWHPSRTFPEKIARLPRSTRYVLADAAYDTNRHGERIEYDHLDRRTGRRLLCPQIYRRGEHRRPDQPRVEKGSRKRRRQRRDQRRAFFERPWSQNLFRQRSTTVEPFNDWLKTRFDLHERAWHRGLDNNRTQILAILFSYQILLRYNHRHGHRNGQIQWILDTL